jgi:hypothetical protein
MISQQANVPAGLCRHFACNGGIVRDVSTMHGGGNSVLAEDGPSRVSAAQGSERERGVVRLTG